MRRRQQRRAQREHRHDRSGKRGGGNRVAPAVRPDDQQRPDDERRAQTDLVQHSPQERPVGNRIARHTRTVHDASSGSGAFAPISPR